MEETKENLLDYFHADHDVADLAILQLIYLKLKWLLIIVRKLKTVQLDPLSM